MVVAMLSGVAYLFSMLDVMKSFMHSAAIWWLTASIVLSLGSLHFFMKRRFAASGAMLFVSLLGMVAVRHIVRLLRLDGAYTPSSVPVHPQWDVFLPFLVCFLVTLGVVGYMLKLACGRPPSDASG
jgi:divalent metal cation (Fe/Co/Zn/Cd) transporter